MSIFDELFNPLYEPLPDLNQYLARIGVTGPCPPSKETLDKLILAHQRTVPFENLDVYDADGEVSLATSALFEKIVTRRRGGYCFEMNGIFTSVLQKAGFDCYSVAARIVWNATRPMPVTHRAIIVTIDGEKYFCDVGFGGPSPQGALKLEYDREYRVRNDVFIPEKEGIFTVITRKTADGRERLQMFHDHPAEPVDFLAPNYYQSKSPTSGFKMMRMLNMLTETGAISLNGNVLRIHDNGVTEERVLETEAELKEAMEKYYGLRVDFPLKA